MVNDAIQTTVLQYVSSEVYSEEWDLEAMRAALGTIYPVSFRVRDFQDVDDPNEVLEKVLEEALGAYEEKEEQVGPEVMRELERMVLLSIIDNKWREHLYEMDYLEEGIHLRAYGQRDPLVEYQREGYLLFQAMTEAIKEESIGYLFNLEVEVEQPAEEEAQGEAERLWATVPEWHWQRLTTEQLSPLSFPSLDADLQ